MSKSQTGRALRVALGLALLPVPLALVAGVLPHSFEDGTVASAAAVNENFDALALALSAQGSQLAGLGTRTVTSSVVLRSPDGSKCTRLAIGNASYELAATPVDCTSFATVGLEVFGGAYRLGGGVTLKSCQQYRTHGAYTGEGSGAYWIDPDGSGTGAAYKVYCDQDRDGGGWTLVYDMGVHASGGTASIPSSRALTTQGPLSRNDFLNIGYGKIRIYNATGVTYAPVDNNDRIFGTLNDDAAKLYDFMASTAQDQVTFVQFGETYSDNFATVHSYGDRIYRVNSDANDTQCNGGLQSSGANSTEFCLQSSTDSSFLRFAPGVDISAGGTTCDGPFWQDAQGLDCSSANFLTIWIK